MTSLFPHLHASFPPSSPSLTSLVVSEDLKHHVYFLTGPSQWMDCPAADLFLGSCFSDAVFVTLVRTAVETAISGVHKLPLGTGTGTVTESRRDQEEGGELDSHEAATEPRGDQEQGGGAGLQRESWTSFTSVVSQRRSYGHCLCDSVLHSIWHSSCVVLWSLRNAGRTPP